jgi:small subunit ribosomal protein S19
MARSIRKGPYVAQCLLDRVHKVKSSGKREVIKTWKRASLVVPDMVGLTIEVHDGRKFVSVFITENMVGHVLGEFAPTRTFRLHSGQRKAEKVVAGAPGAPGVPTAPGAPAAPAAAPTVTPTAPTKGSS